MQSPNQGKMERITSVPDEFAFETRLVVLNFMGLMPASCPPLATIDWPPATLEHRRSLTGHYASSERSDVAMPTVSSQGDLLGGNEDQLTEPYTLIRKGTHLRLYTSSEIYYGTGSGARPSSAAESASCVVNGGQTSQDLDWDAPSVWITPASPPEALDQPLIGDDASRSIPVPGLLETTDRCLVVKSMSSDSSASEEHMHKSLHGTQSKRSSIVSCQLSLHPEEGFLSVERQRSLQSFQSGSSRSLAPFRRNSYVDVRQVDVTNLVQAQTLPSVAFDLKEEISKSIENLEKSFAHFRTERPIPPVLLQCPPSLSSASALVSPESQVADMLRVIGDRVEDDYSVFLNNATDELLQLQQLGRLTYDSLQEAALHLLHHSSTGWTQVALVLLLSQRLSLTLLAQGDRSVGRLAEYTARFITDHIADFILSKGGWQSITEIGVVETPLPISDDPVLSAVDTCASSDQLSSISDIDPVKVENSNAQPSTAGSWEVPVSPVTWAASPGSACPQDSFNDDVHSLTKNGTALEANTASHEYRNKSRAANGCQHSVIESSETPEYGEFRVPLLLGVCIFAIFGTWVVYKRIRKG